MKFSLTTSSLEINSIKTVPPRRHHTKSICSKYWLDWRHSCSCFNNQLDKVLQCCPEKSQRFQRLKQNLNYLFSWSTTQNHLLSSYTTIIVQKAAFQVMYTLFKHTSKADYISVINISLRLHSRFKKTTTKTQNPHNRHPEATMLINSLPYHLSHLPLPSGTFKQTYFFRLISRLTGVTHFQCRSTWFSN